MMNDDELRASIGRLDPLGSSEDDGVSIPHSSPEARELLETIMATPSATKEAQQPIPTRPPEPAPGGPGAALLLAGATALLVVGVLAGLVIAGNNSGQGEQRDLVLRDGDFLVPVEEQDVLSDDPASVLNLTAAEEDLFASCLRPDASVVAQSQIAFLGTVVSSEGGVVTLMVEEAYVGTEADSVTLSAPEGLEALIGGVAWQVGEAYLVSASAGTGGVPAELGGTEAETEGSGSVNYCGLTGLATADLQAFYDEAFGGS